MKRGKNGHKRKHADKIVDDCLSLSEQRARWQLFYCRGYQTKNRKKAVSGHGNISGTTRLLVANSK